MLQIALAMLLTAAPQAEVFVDRDAGYVLRLPAGWERIPDDVLAHICEAIGGAAEESNYIAAFGPRGRALYFQYPYILVSLVEHQRPIDPPKVARDQIVQLAEDLTGASMLAWRAKMPRSIEEIVLGFETGPAVALGEPPGFVQQSRIQYSTLERAVRAVTIGLVGRTNTVVVNFCGVVQGCPRLRAHCQGVLSHP